MKKFITTLVIGVMLMPTVAMADLYESNDGSMLVDAGHTREASCLWYLGNFRYLFDAWSDKVNDVIKTEINRIK